jgi:hydrogenase expression/formation protein HypC
MCLGIPGKVIEVHDVAGLRMGKVDFGGVRKEACLAYTPEVELGDYVIVHVGFAISRVDEEEAMKTLEILGSMGDMMEQELATMGPGMDAPAVEDESSAAGLIAALRQVSAPAREGRTAGDAQADGGGPVS